MAELDAGHHFAGGFGERGVHPARERDNFSNDRHQLPPRRVFAFSTLRPLLFNRVQRLLCGNRRDQMAVLRFELLLLGSDQLHLPFRALQSSFNDSTTCKFETNS